jgi:hypothetical protein
MITARAPLDTPRRASEAFNDYSVVRGLAEAHATKTEMT